MYKSPTDYSEKTFAVINKLLPKLGSEIVLLAFMSALLKRPNHIFVLNKIIIQKNKTFSYPLHTHTLSMHS